MDTSVLEKRFGQMGARVKVSEIPDDNRRGNSPFSIDIRRDSEGEFFDIRVRNEVEILILDVQKDDRHLLLMTKDHRAGIRNRLGQVIEPPGVSKFLCGHDERNWFTCAVPGTPGIPVSTVRQAKEALKPAELREVESREGLRQNRAHKRHRRLNSGRKIHRQGEFMFIPEPGFQPPGGSLVIIHRNEPMRRTGMAGNAHMAQYLYRTGGRQVYVSRSGQMISVQEYETMVKANPEAKAKWNPMRADMIAFVKGKITHREHKTLDLGEIWHRVLLNTEGDAPGMQFVRFVD